MTSLPVLFECGQEQVMIASCFVQFVRYSVFQGYPFSAISLAVPPAVPHAIIATLRHAAALFQQIHAYSCAFRICHSFLNKQTVAT